MHDQQKLEVLTVHNLKYNPGNCLHIHNLPG